MVSLLFKNGQWSTQGQFVILFVTFLSVTFQNVYASSVFDSTRIRGYKHGLLSHSKDGQYKPETKVKIVNYAVKVENKVQLSTMGVKNLKIEPNADWIAKGVWNGNDYNTTGYAYRKKVNYKMYFIILFF